MILIIAFYELSSQSFHILANYNFTLPVSHIRDFGFALDSFLPFFHIPHLVSEQISLTPLAKSIHYLTFSLCYHSDPSQHLFLPGEVNSLLLHTTARVILITHPSDVLSLLFAKCQSYSAPNQLPRDPKDST